MLYAVAATAAMFCTIGLNVKKALLPCLQSQVCLR